MRIDSPPPRRRPFTIGGLVACLVLAATPASGQERVLEGDPDRPSITSSTAVPFTSVGGIDLLSPRLDGPPVLVLSLDDTKVRLAPGTYRSRDGTALRVSDHGQIIELAGGDLGSRSLRVARIDELSDRSHQDRPRVVLSDSRSRTVALPDGRYVNEDGVVIAVREATVVGYGVEK